MKEIGVLGRGAYLQRGRVTWRIKLCKDSVYHLENPETGEVCTITYDECMLGCVTGSIRPVSAPGADLDEATRSLLQIPLDNFPDRMKESVMRKAGYIEAFQDMDSFYTKHFPDLPPGERITNPRLSAPTLRRLLPMIAQAIGDPKPPGPSTFIKWFGRWVMGKIAGNADIRVLADKLSSRGPQKALMSPRMAQWVEETVNAVLLHERHRTRRKVYEVLREKVRQWNKAHPDDQEVMLSLRHVQRLCNDVDKYEAAVRRDGRQAADRVFRPIGVSPDPLGILEVVEVDHTLLDVEVVDPATGLSLGRPTLTVALDRYSRIPVAAHVHFDGPSLIAVTAAIRQAMLPKTFLLESHPKLKDYLNYFGLPVSFFFDRGVDFDSDHIRQIALTLDVRLDYEPAGVPEMKARVERFCGTLNREVCHELPGARPPKDTSPDKLARTTYPVVTLDELKKRMWTWILGVYIQREHDTLGVSPAERWKQSRAEREVRPPRAESELGLLGTRYEYCRVTRKGIRWQYLRWNADILKTIRSRPTFKPGELVKVKIDDANVALAWIVDPTTRVDLPLEPVHKRYMTGLTLHLHRMVLRKIKQNKEDPGDNDVLMESLAEVNAEIAEFDSRRAGKGRSGKTAYTRARHGEGATPADVELATATAPGVVVEDLDEPDEDDPDGDDNGGGPSRWATKKVRKS